MWKSIIVIYHSKRTKDRNYLITSIDTEETLDQKKNPMFFHDKTVNKQEIISQPDKGNLQKNPQLTASLMLND